MPWNYLEEKIINAFREEVDYSRKTVYNRKYSG
jgi:hypothetical protein